MSTGYQKIPLVYTHVRDKRFDDLLFDGYEVNQTGFSDQSALNFRGKTRGIKIHDSVFFDTERAILFHRFNVWQNSPLWHDGPALEDIEIDGVVIDGHRVTNFANDSNTGEMILFHGNLHIPPEQNLMRNIQVRNVISRLPKFSPKDAHSIIQLWSMSIKDVSISQVVAPWSAINIAIRPGQYIDGLSILDCEVKNISLRLMDGATIDQVQNLRIDDDYPVKIVTGKWLKDEGRFEREWEFDHLQQAKDHPEVPNNSHNFSVYTAGGAAIDENNKLAFHNCDLVLFGTVPNTATSFYAEWDSEHTPPTGATDIEFDSNKVKYRSIEMVVKDHNGNIVAFGNAFTDPSNQVANDPTPTHQISGTASKPGLTVALGDLAKPSDPSGWCPHNWYV